MRITDRDMQAIVHWMDEGGTLDLPPKQKELFLRAQKAYQRLLEYKSDRVTLQHLKADYGASYSEATCRRDLAVAKMLFGYRTPASWEFTSGMIIDWGLEMMAKAAKENDRKGWAQIAAQVYRFAGGDKAQERPFDPETLANPIPREITIDPRLVGAVEDPLLEEKMRALLGEKRMKGLSIPSFPKEGPVTDADFEEVKP